MKYRKKSIVIEAKKLIQENLNEILSWVHHGLPPEANSILTIDVGGCRVRTLEGSLYAPYGDWIIKGIKGEFYSCKPDVFEATYEPVK